METRKAQLTGGTTYTVSLPKSWATEQGIEAGSVLSLYPNEDGSILIEPQTRSASEEYTATVDIHGYDDHQLRQAIYALYLSGIERITILDSTGSLIDRQRIVSEVLESLVGIEIIDAVPEKLVLENMTDARSISIRKSALRLRLIVLSMHRDAIEATITNDDALAHQVIDRDDEVDKLLALIVRYFQRSLISLNEVERLETTRAELFEYYYTTRQLERIGDHAEKAARLTLDQPEPISNEFVEEIRTLGDQSREIIEKSSDVVFSDTHVSEAFDVLKHRNTIDEKIDSMNRELYELDSSQVAQQLGLLLDSLKRSADYGANIAEAAIQCAARTETLPGQRDGRAVEK